MAYMTIGAIPLTINPKWDKELKKRKVSSSVNTYESVAYFSQGVRYDGVEINLSWDYMPLALYNALNTLFEADAALVFDPQDGSGKTFNIEIVTFDGVYYLKNNVSNTFIYRKDVKMKILILNEIVQ
jgi:hypothetical protein